MVDYHTTGIGDHNQFTATGVSSKVQSEAFWVPQFWSNALSGMFEFWPHAFLISSVGNINCRGLFNEIGKKNILKNLLT